MKEYNNVSDWLYDNNISAFLPIRKDDSTKYSKNMLISEISKYTCVMEISDKIYITTAITISDEQYKHLDSIKNIPQAAEIEIIKSEEDKVVVLCYTFESEYIIDEGLTANYMIDIIKDIINQTKCMLWVLEHAIIMYEVNKGDEEFINTMLDTKIYDKNIYIDKIKIERDYGLY